MPSSPTPSDFSLHRTYSASYVIGPEPAIWPPFFDPLPSMFVLAPSRRKPRRKRARAALSPADRSGMYAGLLAVDTYSEAARDALIEGDDGALRNALSVLRAIVKVVAGQISGASSKQLSVR